jgi:hypothetical protein
MRRTRRGTQLPHPQWLLGTRHMSCQASSLHVCMVKMSVPCPFKPVLSAEAVLVCRGRGGSGKCVTEISCVCHRCRFAPTLRGVFLEPLTFPRVTRAAWLRDATGNRLLQLNGCTGVVVCSRSTTLKTFSRCPGKETPLVLVEEEWLWPM